MSNFIWDKYEVKKKPIGKGKKGMVYKAYDALNDKIVAIKKMPNIERAQREADVMKAYGSHKYLPEFYDFFIIDYHAHIVMEWIDGETLKGQIRNLNQQSVLKITLKILEGLQHLHETGFIHHDLNRGNVMLLNPDQEIAKVIDLGSARLLKHHSSKEKTEYQNQNRVVSHRLCEEGVDERNDLATVAGLCVYLLSGKKARTFKKVKSVKNKELEKVLSQALHPDKEKRYRTAQEMIAALKPFV